MNCEIKRGLVSLHGDEMADVFKGKSSFQVFMQDGLDASKLSNKLKGVSTLVIHIQGGRSMKIGDCKRLVEEIADYAGGYPEVVWGAQTGNKKKLMIMAAW